MISLKKPTKPMNLKPRHSNHNNKLDFIVFSALILFSIGLFYSLFNFIGNAIPPSSPQIQITGYSTSGTGNVLAEVLDTVSIQFNNASPVDRSINFGSGYVNVGCNYCEISSEGSSDENCCEGDWRNISQDYLLLENIGNIGAKIMLAFSSNASLLFGNANSEYSSIKYKAVDNETGSCMVGMNNSWFNIGQSTFDICDHLSHNSNNNSIRIYFKLRIPNDALFDIKGVNVNAVGEVSQYEYE